MGTQKVSIRYLIDVAIGSPEPGIVNFNALYTVLQAISEKLALQDHHIEIDSSFCPVDGTMFDSKSNVSSERLMDHQVFDFTSEIDQERPIEMKNRDRDQLVGVETDCRKQPADEDKKVVFEKAEEVVSSVSGRIRGKEADRLASYRSELRQHIDALNARLGKIENIFSTTTDTDQGMECTRRVVQQLQERMDEMQVMLDELREIRAGQDQDLSACRKKLEHDSLSAGMAAMKREIADLREALGKSNTRVKMPSIIPTFEVIGDIKGDYARLQDQVLEMKSNICELTENVNQLEKVMMGGKRSSAVVTVDMFQEELMSLKQFIETAGTDVSYLQAETSSQKNSIDALLAKVEELTKLKVDKEEIDELLSEKADYTMLQRKVSVENMTADRRKLEKQLSEMTECFVMNEDRVQKQISDIKKFLGDQSLEDMLYDFKLRVDKDIQVVRDAIRRLAEMKPDMDSATARLKDLTCISCEQDVVMKAVEMNNLSKFGNAYVSKTISPEVAFELAKLREAGRIGSLESSDLICDMARHFRSVGGMHTIVTKKDRVTKGKGPRHGPKPT